ECFDGCLQERLKLGRSGAVDKEICWKGSDCRLSGRIGIRDHAAYCASKGGLDGLTRVMAKELAPHGIRANGVHPTVTLTP
ncbi:SDR family NAD(P)-dependent oxidoreductase, partial [Rhizobium johnstonii]